MNIPAYEGENPRVNIGSSIINGKSKILLKPNHIQHEIKDKIVYEKLENVSVNGIKVYNQTACVKV